jgi:hypothetical protein
MTTVSNKSKPIPIFVTQGDFVRWANKLPVEKQKALAPAVEKWLVWCLKNPPPACPCGCVPFPQ